MSGISRHRNRGEKYSQRSTHVSSFYCFTSVIQKLCTKCFYLFHPKIVHKMFLFISSFCIQPVKIYAFATLVVVAAAAVFRIPVAILLRRRKYCLLHSLFNLLRSAEESLKVILLFVVYYLFVSSFVKRIWVLIAAFVLCICVLNWHVKC